MEWHYFFPGFDLTLLENVECTFRDLGPITNQLDVQRLFTNALVHAL